MRYIKTGIALVCVIVFANAAIDLYNATIAARTMLVKTLSPR